MKISQACFAERRRRLIEQLPANSVALIPGASIKARNGENEYAFRQDSDFYYLTGFNEPDSLLVLIPGREEGQVILFCPPRDRTMEIWTGYRAGPEGCVERFGADQAFNLDEIDARLPQLLNGRESLYYPVGADTAFDESVSGWLNELRRDARRGFSAPSTLVFINDLIHEMRLFKDAEEVELMRAAGEISAQAHIRAMQASRPGLHEYVLEGAIVGYCMQQGARFQSYNPIVGSGENGCILHYDENEAVMQDGDLVLIDAGCEVDGYAGDITRTFPVNGRFSPEQRALYDLVLKTNIECIEAMQVGTPRDDIQTLSVKILTEGLVELGLLKGKVDELIESKAYRDFYMHGIGHWLGLDVHDVGRYKVDGESRPLEPGMVMTIEPGIYVAPDNMDVDARWRGIGIRVEDDILITNEGPEVLTASVPKDADEIEALMAGRQGGGE